jgi:hypothetical protein
MHTLYQLYLNFEYNHNPIIKLVESQFLPNNQYMKPYISTHIVFLLKKK